MGVGLPRKRKISSSFLYCSQSKCKLQIIQFFSNVILEVEQRYYWQFAAFGFFSRNHFLRGDFITSYFNEWEVHFQQGIHLQDQRATHWGSICFDGRDKKIHGVGGTPIMPLPTRANPGLCCNRIKKKHELQYAPENLQEKDLNFTRKGISSQRNF